MSTVIDTGLSLAAIRGEFFQRYDAVQLYYPSATLRIPSTSKSEDIRFLGHVPRVRVFGAGRVAQGLGSYRYQVENQKYEDTIEVDRDEKSDDQLGQINIRIGEIAEAAAQHKDELLADLFENGGTAGFVGYNGLTFWNDAHTLGNSGAMDNNLSLNVNTPGDPTAAELFTAVGMMIQQLRTFKDDQGRPLNVNMSGLELWVPPNMEIAAATVLQAAIIAQTNNVLASRAKLVVFPYLASTDKLYLLATGSESRRPFAFLDREPIEFGALEQTSDQGFMTEKYLYGIRARYMLTYAHFTSAIRMTLT